MRKLKVKFGEDTREYLKKYFVKIGAMDQNQDLIKFDMVVDSKYLDKAEKPRELVTITYIY